MAIAQYASLRSQLPPLTAETLSGGNLSGGQVNFSYQGRNRAGVNRSSVVASVSYGAGDRIQVTLPATARETGEDIHYWIISAGIDPDPANHVQVAIYQGYDADQSTPRPLPYTIEFSEDTHLALSATVPNEISLPSGPDLINGMLRGVVNLSKILRYDAEATDAVDNVTVFSAAVGRWIQYGAFSTYIINTVDPGGCDQPLGSVSDASLIPAPRHPGDGRVGTYVRLWWILNRTEGAGLVTAGKRFQLSWQQSGASRSALLSDQAKWRVNGFTRLADGTLDTADLTTTERDYIYGKSGAYVLEKDLPSGYAIDIGVALAVDVSEFEFALPDGADIRVRPFFFSQSGAPNPAGQLVGDVIYNTGNQRLIVPGASLTAIALDGAGTIKNFDFTQGETLVTGLTANTADQALAINGDGVVTVEGVSPTLDTTQVERAKVGTVSGVSSVGAASAYAAVSAGDTVTITVNHPVSSGNGVIRSDYPDTDIAGNSLGTFNPSSLRIYGQRQSDGQVREFTGFAPLMAATQDISINNWSDGSIALLPSADATFSLFHSDLPSAVTASGSSDFTGDDYRWYVAYEYSGNQVTSIDHGNGVHTASRSAAEWDEAADAVLSCNTVTTLASYSNAVNWDMGQNCYYSLTLSENVGTIEVTNITQAKTIHLEVINPGGAYTVGGWDSDITWVGGAPSAPSAWAVYEFISFDGSTVRAAPWGGAGVGGDANAVTDNGEVVTDNGETVTETP